MNPHSALLKVTGVAFLAIASSYFAVACGDDSGNTPMVDAGGQDQTTSSSSGTTSSSSGTTSSSSGTTSSSSGTSSSSSSGGSSSSGSSGDGGTGDACAPDGSSPFNSCGYPNTITCLPYSNAEAGVPSPLPAVM